MKITRKISLLLALCMAIMALAGCAATHRVLHDTDTLRVERDGKYLMVYDLAAGDTYTLATKRILRSEAAAAGTKVLADTDTITITAEPNVTTITDKTAGTIVTIERRHR